MLKEFLSTHRTTSGGPGTEVFFDARRPVHKTERKKTKFFYS